MIFTVILAFGTPFSATNRNGQTIACLRFGNTRQTLCVHAKKRTEYYSTGAE